MLNPEAHVWSSSVTDRNTACSLSPLTSSSGAVTDRFAALEDCDYCRPENTGVYSFRIQFYSVIRLSYSSLGYTSYSFTLQWPKSSSLPISCGILSQRLLCQFPRPRDYVLLWPSSSLIHFFLFANFTSLQRQS
jgi:hypothetical protein